MVRPRPRKTVEELYAPKYETTTNAAKHTNNHAPPNHGGATAKSKRPPEPEYAMPSGGGTGFILNSTTVPLNGATMATSRMQRNNAPNTSTAMTTRRKITHQVGPQATGTRFSKEEQDRLRLEELKKEHASLAPNMVKVKTCRMSGGGVEKVITSSANGKSSIATSAAAAAAAYPSYGDEMKDALVCGQLSHQHHHHITNHHGQQQHRHHQNSGPMMAEEDKEDETEEFFELIRMTVEAAIGKAFSDLFNRNFRELSHKVDTLSSELKSTNDLLAKVQNEVNNKVTHYGEENSRHFRYLCMKSEYDKMFYQHHAMMSNNANASGQVPMPAKLPFPPAATYSAKSSGAIPKRERTDLSMKRQRQHTGDGSKTSVAGDGFATSRRATTSAKEPYRTWSDERVLSPKSSEVCMRELLEHIQRFCNQLQLNELKPGEETAQGNHSTATMCNDEGENNLKASTSSYHTVNLMQTAMDQHQQKQQQHNQFGRRPPSRLEQSMKFTKRVFVGDDDDEDDDFAISSDGMSPRSEDDATPTTKGYSGGMTMRSSVNTARTNGAGGDS